MRIDAAERGSYYVLKILIGEVFMVLGWQIFVHALRMVFGNFREAMRIALGPSLCALILLAGLYIATGPTPADSVTGFAEPVFTGPQVLITFLTIIICGAVLLWIAVAWHRFILLEEYPRRPLPALRLDQILGYLGWSLRIALLLVLFAMIVGVVVYFVVSVAAPAALVAFLVASKILTSFLFLRLSPVLPAVAIGKPITLRAAWSATAGHTGAFVVLTLSLWLFNVLVELGVDLFAPFFVVYLVLLFLVYIVFKTFFAISILTTLYGVFIEKRELT